jgi:hypothetical protein
MFESTNSQKLGSEHQALWVLFSAAMYGLAFKANSFLFDGLEFTPNVSWIFIPSGIRLVFVLVLHQSGAMGIALASCLINYTYGDPDAHLFNILTGLISGMSPFLARAIAIDLLKLNTNLNGLTVSPLFKTSVLFALISATLHQTWYFWYGVTDRFFSNTLVMFIGDCLGTVFVMAFVSFLFKIYQKIFKN